MRQISARVLPDERATVCSDFRSIAFVRSLLTREQFRVTLYTEETEAFVGSVTRVLCVDDSDAFCRALKRVMRTRGWTVDPCADTVAALATVREQRHDLVLLDWRMPGTSGHDTCRLLRATSAMLPIIVLTVEEGVSEKLLAFAAGADDYILKSANVDELCARMTSVLRRSQRRDGTRGQRIVCPLYEGLEVDLLSHRVLLDGRMVHTTPAEARFLVLLMQAGGRLVPLDETVAFVFDKPPADPANSVRVLATQLRRRIARSGLQLRGKGAAYGLFRASDQVVDGARGERVGEIKKK